MKCYQCGTPVPDGSPFCRKCGGEESDPVSAPADIREVAELEAPSSPVIEPDDLFQLVKWELSKDYDVETELGRGGMAVVYRAREVDLGRTVALKVLPPELALGAAMSDRFKREARMAASLDHPNIIPVYRVGNVGKIFFIAMKYIEGLPLDTILEQQGALPIPVALQVLRGAAHALAYAHEHGIVHRDIKGANILIQKDGRPVVSDFGVARAIEEKSVTATGALIGTPFFMSPEQCAGKQVGPQSDQYSLGVVAFQVLTGTVPFDADSVPGIMQHHWFTPVPDVAAVRQDVPKPLLDVIYRALAKDPKQRFTTTTEMAEALDAVPIGEKDRQWGNAMLKELSNGTILPKISTISLPPLSSTPGLRHLEAPANERRLRRRSYAALGVGLAALAAGGFWWSSRPEPRPLAGLRLDSAAGASTVLPVGDPLPGSTAVTASTGTVRVRGLPPGARLLIDGKPVPSTQTFLPPGNYDYTILATGYQSESGRVKVAAGEVTTFDGSLDRITETIATPAVATGKIRLRTDPPDAEIAIDDRPVGRGVLVDYDIPAGTRRVRISAQGYLPFDTTIVVRAGETTALGRKTLRADTP